MLPALLKLAAVLLLGVLQGGCDKKDTYTPPTAVCGNFFREYGEECDDGNLLPGDFCTPECKRPDATCGNGIVEGREECDDGNKTNGDGCDFTCFIETNGGDGETAGDLGDVVVDSPPLDGTDRPPADPVERAEDAGVTDTVPDPTGDSDDLCMERICPDIECDLWTQTGCEFAEKCSIVDIDRVCVSAGTSTEGQTCTDETQCGVGLTCLTNGTSGQKMCYRFCRDDFDCMGTGSLCIYDLTWDGMPVPYVHLCSKACDPVSNIGCPGQFSCMIYQEPGGLRRYLTDCDPHQGEGRDGDTCTGDAGCGSGFFCMPGPNVCVRYCRYPTGYCVEGTCNAFSPRVLLGTIEYGYCYEW